MGGPGGRGCAPPRTLYVYSFWAPIVCAFQFLPSCASMHVSICPRLPPVCVFAIFPEFKTEKINVLNEFISNLTFPFHVFLNLLMPPNVHYMFSKILISYSIFSRTYQTKLKNLSACVFSEFSISKIRELPTIIFPENDAVFCFNN